MKTVSYWFLLPSLLIFIACQPEAPDLSVCEREVPLSSLNAMDREVLSVIVQNYGTHYFLSETIETRFSLFGDMPYDIDSITIWRADERNLNRGFIGKNDFNITSVITREHFNCIGATLNLDDWNAPRFMGVSLPGYNTDSTQALVNVSRGTYNGFSSECEVYLEKQNGIWQMFSFPCATP